MNLGYTEDSDGLRSWYRLRFTALFASSIALYIVWWYAGDMFGAPLRLVFVMFVLFV